MAQQQNHSLSLLKLIENINDISVLKGNLEQNITGITADSRQVKPGYLFAAISGVASNGADFIPSAIANGAIAILCDNNITCPDNITVITHTNTKLALALLAANFYQLQPEVIVAITGTNGKTSIAYFCTQIWQLLGKNSASIGTLGIATNQGIANSAAGFMTTPDPVKLHEILAVLHAEGVTNLAMEASSHGLDQYRLDGVHIKAAAFTNITRDHLDYHGNFENYLQAKLRIFDIMHEGVAVINADLPESDKIITLCQNKNHKILSLGKGGKYIELYDITPTSNGSQIAFSVMGRLYTVNTHLIGEFQAYNLLTALALVAGCGANIDEIVATLEYVAAVPGRMQGVRINNDFARIYVDYAHTPDALEKVLLVLRPYTEAKLWVVFGCGGDRDKGKRPQMGEIAAKLSDNIIVTDDNPRSENGADIRRQIIAKCPNAKEIADRREAIHYAINNMGKDDILLIAGKGHEKTQIIGNEKFDFDDVLVAKEAISEASHWNMEVP